MSEQTEVSFDTALMMAIHTVYILSWEQRGISNTIMGNISQDEIARIAENIFNMSLHVIC